MITSLEMARLSVMKFASALAHSRVRVVRTSAVACLAVGLVCATPDLGNPVLAALPELTLTLTTSDGMMRLGNYEASPVAIDYYKISGSNGYFAPANWTSLHDQNLPGFPAGNGSGNGWEEFIPLNSQRLAEGFLFGSSTFSSGLSINLGPAFNTAITNPQIALEFAVADGDPFGIPDGTILDGFVQIVSSLPLMPDVNMDGYVDIFDVNLISDNWGSVGLPGTVAGDATNDGIVDIFDINLVSASWNEPPLALPVPEPASIALLLGAALGLVVASLVSTRRGLRR